MVNGMPTAWGQMLAWSGSSQLFCNQGLRLYGARWRWGRVVIWKEVKYGRLGGEVGCKAAMAVITDQDRFSILGAVLSTESQGKNHRHKKMLRDGINLVPQTELLEGFLRKRRAKQAQIKECGRNEQGVEKCIAKLISGFRALNAFAE